MAYYRDIVTQKSWEFLQTLVRTHRFLLIGGWAVWLYTKQLKSKDIDMVVEFPVLESLRQQYPLVKNNRLKKYEIIQQEVHVDIYVPQWSDIGVPSETILDRAIVREGFRIPRAEMLIELKLVAYQARAGSVKGRKDIIDIVSLLSLDECDWDAVRAMKRDRVLTLVHLIASQTDLPELALNRHTYARLKKQWLSQLI